MHQSRKRLPTNRSSSPERASRCVRCACSVTAKHEQKGTTMSLLITNATIIDAVSDKPIEGRSILIEGTRIKAIGGRDELAAGASGAKVIDARGKYVIPGLMNANVHLFVATSIERMARHHDHF